MSTALTCLAILVLGILITGTSIMLVRRFVPERLRGNEERREPVFAFAGVLYALVIGFVLAYALDGYQTAETAAGTEADSVNALSRAATLFDAESRDRIGHELICYSRAVIDDEWPLLHSGHRSELTTAANDRLFQSFGKLGRTNPDNSALSSSLERVSDLNKARATRLLKSNTFLPTMFWVFMVAGGLMLILYATVLKGREPIRGQVLFILPVTLLLLCSIYLVGVFEQPFRGPNALEPVAMERALSSVTEFIPDPRADRPCP
ncbi:MAG: DUF4239 domain-containing protein [Solirubrobacterales bacterium]|nr:DUF4239 domain-containing protein [Solirubrobacterales bacterium]